MDAQLPREPKRSRNHRRSIRLPDYDYAQEGMYYITICVADRIELFGKLDEDRIILDDIGKVVEYEWRRTPQLRPNVSLQDLVVDHMHAILTIAVRWSVSLGCARDLRLHTPSPRRLTSPSQTVGSIVRGFKAASTRQINTLQRAPDAKVWQRNYYEHVVRDEQDLAAIRQYIHDNPIELMRKMRELDNSRRGLQDSPQNRR